MHLVVFMLFLPGKEKSHFALLPLVGSIRTPSRTYSEEMGGVPILQKGQSGRCWSRAVSDCQTMGFLPPKETGGLWNASPL